VAANFVIKDYHKMYFTEDLLLFGNGLFMHFSDSNHEVTQMQQEEKQQHQRAEINFILMRIQNLKTFRFHKLMIVF